MSAVIQQRQHEHHGSHANDCLKGKYHLKYESTQQTVAAYNKKSGGFLSLC